MPSPDIILLVVAVSVILLVFILVFRFKAKMKKRQQVLFEKGLKAAATVTSINHKSYVRYSNFYHGVEVGLKVHPTDGKSFEIKNEQYFHLFKFPDEGDKVTVIYDPDNLKECRIIEPEKYFVDFSAA